MTNSKRLAVAAGLFLACGCLFLIAILTPGIVRFLSARRTPTPDVAATFRALLSTETSVSSASAAPGSTPASTLESTPVPGSLGGHIVFTCQIFKFQSSDQICIMNPDGSGYRRLTTEDGVRHFYPSLAPDGQSVVYSQYREDNIYELYEMNILSGAATRLTDRLGTETGPEISPDGKSIVFMRWTVASDQNQIWVMDRGGANPRRVFDGIGWDPTWSPDGKQILFASDRGGANQLYIGNLDGSGVHQISHLPALVGRSDWSPQNLVVTYSGDSWKKEVYLMNLDGSNQHRVSPPGGNSQGPSFSPDGQWIAFTAYFDHPNDIHGCEIYVVRVDGTDLRRLTDNDYCDYQPRWGP